MHVFVSCRWSSVIVIFNIHGDKTRRGRGDHAVEQQFGGGEAGGVGDGDARVIQVVAAHCDTDAVLFLFWGTERPDKSGICDGPVGQDGGQVTKIYSVGSRWYPLPDTLCEPSKVVCQSLNPNGFVRPAY